MDELKEIVKVIKKTKLKKTFSLYEEEGNVQNNRYRALYNALVSDTITTDEEAAEFLGFGMPDNDFRVFKSDFGKKALNTLYTVDFNQRNSSDYSRAVFDISGKRHIVKLLILLGERDLAQRLTKKYLIKALRFELTDAIMDFYLALRGISSTKGKLFHYNRYQKLYNFYLKRLMAENEAGEIIDRFQMRFSMETEPKPSYGRIILQDAKIVEKLYKKHKTMILAAHYFRLKGYGHYVLQNYQSSLEAWQEMAEKFKDAPHTDFKGRIAEANMQQLGCYLHLRQYEKGLECALLCKSIYHRDNNNWFTFMELYYLHGMQSGNYAISRQVLEEVEVNPRFESISQRAGERWPIYKGYLEWVTLLYTKDRKENITSPPFIDNLKFYEKDKKGFNVSILILKLLYSFLNKDRFSLLHERTEALRRYDRRHLRKDNVRRCHLFLEMLFLLENQDTIALTEQKTEPLYKKMLDSTLKHEGAMDGMEIIPFEKLWMMVLNLFKQK